MRNDTNNVGELSREQLEMVAGAGWFSDAIDWVSDAASDVGDWVNDRVEDVADWVDDNVFDPIRDSLTFPLPLPDWEKDDDGDALPSGYHASGQ